MNWASFFFCAEGKKGNLVFSVLQLAKRIEKCSYQSKETKTAYELALLNVPRLKWTCMPKSFVMGLKIKSMGPWNQTWSITLCRSFLRIFLFLMWHLHYWISITYKRGSLLKSSSNKVSSDGSQLCESECNSVWL